MESYLIEKYAYNTFLVYFRMYFYLIINNLIFNLYNVFCFFPHALTFNA